MIVLTREAIDPEQVRKSVESPEYGGVVVFVGEVRAVSDGIETTSLEYEAYEAMAEEQMRGIAREAEKRWGGRVAMAHRLGELFPGEVAVVAAAACVHRSAAFECCRFLIEGLKKDVPIWKKEFGTCGEFWVEGETRLLEGKI